MKQIVSLFFIILLSLQLIACDSAKSATRTEHERTVVYIIPGIFGSWSTEMFNHDPKSIFDVQFTLDLLRQAGQVQSSTIPREWTIDPITGSYDQLRADLVKSYGAHNVYDFAYDWRKSIAQTAYDLHDRINDTLMANPDITSVKFVAHSMGGLVARYYAQNLASSHTHIPMKAVLIGTPHRGSVVMYKTWQQGNFFRMRILEPAVMEIILENMKEGHGLGDISDHDYIHTIPSIGELTPTFDHVWRSAGRWYLYEHVPVTSMCYQNNFLYDLNASVDDLINSHVEFLIIASASEHTNSKVYVWDVLLDECSELQAPDGLVLKSISEPYSGDGRVLLEESAYPVDYIPQFKKIKLELVNGEHGNLPNNNEVHKIILNFLQ